MNNIIVHLQKETTSVLESLGFNPKWAIISPSNRPDISQFQCNAAFEIAKEVKSNPREIANKIVSQLKKKSFIFSIQVDGPGFININLTDEYLIKCLNGLLEDQKRDKLGVPEFWKTSQVIIDFCGANVAKPMHVGHLRSTIIGDSLARLARHLGDEVITDNHLGDWGTQMGLLIALLKVKKSDLPYFRANMNTFPKKSPLTLEELEKLYVEASNLAKTDEEFSNQAQRSLLDLQKGHAGYKALWNHFVNLSLTKMKSDLATLNVQLDLWRGESYYQSMIPTMVRDLTDRGLVEVSEGGGGYVFRRCFNRD